MSDELSSLNLDEDFEDALDAPEASRWTLEKPAALEIWATMSPVGQPGEAFQARLLWLAYPGEPPSLKFRDPATGRLDLSRAWPQVRGFRPGSLDTCVNWTREGMNLHTEWRNDPRYRWDSHGNVLLKTLRWLQEELDEYFQGRAP